MGVWFWILMIIAAVFAVALLIFGFAWIIGRFVDMDKAYDDDNRLYRWFLQTSLRVCVFVMRIKRHVSGLETVPEGRFLLVNNHRSNFDSIIQWTVLPKKQLAFISKESNLRIPFYGRIIHRCNTLSIDRDNPREAMKTINRAAELIKKDVVSFVVTPEGTRSKSGQLLPFHGGVFKIAKKAEVPVVVMAMQGTENIHSNYPLKRSHVYLDIVDVISADDVRRLSTAELSERAREAIRVKLGQ